MRTRKLRVVTSNKSDIRILPSSIFPLGLIRIAKLIKNKREKHDKTFTAINLKAYKHKKRLTQN